jgi:hypothetical protein
MGISCFKAMGGIRGMNSFTWMSYVCFIFLLSLVLRSKKAVRKIFIPTASYIKKSRGLLSAYGFVACSGYASAYHRQIPGIKVIIPKTKKSV